MSLFVQKTEGTTSPTVRPKEAEADNCDYLGRGSRIQGKLRFEGSVRIVGAVDGEIEATESVIVEPGAEVKARITAAVVLVHGYLEAEVVAKERLEIGSSGVLHGKVTTTALVIHEGAVFEGSCAMGGVGRKGSRAEESDPEMRIAASA
jgi:cytoskeletal protein CcmA (bactofilin family)